VRHRPIAPADLAPAARLLGAVGVATLAGLSGPGLDRAFCRAAARADSPFRLILADRAGDLLGFALAVIDPARSYRDFLLRHPAWAARVAADRLAARLRPASPHPAPEDAAPPDPEAAAAEAGAWEASGPDRARIIGIGVAESARGLGVGAGLYHALFADLAARGVVEVRARIARDNHPSVRLHRRTGWRVVDLGGVLEAARDPRAGAGA
jgi:ribosomal protein S18 acetylase RimI-like enzyme